MPLCGIPAGTIPLSQTATLENILSLPDEASQIEAAISDLNPEQKIAALTIDGPVICAAGAGTGKTKTVISRTAVMLIKKIPATNIMLLTFTNKGAGEIKDRLEAMVGDQAQYITAGTFHSLIFRAIIKANPEHQFFADKGIDAAELAILDDEEAKTIMKEAIASMSPDLQEMIADKGWDKEIPAMMSTVRAQGHTAETFAQEYIGFGHPDEVMCRATYDVWNAYSAICRSVNGIDFDDVLVVALALLRADPAIGFELAQRYKYIMLDEYQDTNPVQMSIMDNIAQHHENILAVGDDKQSIYKFRGADIKVIRGFTTRYPNAKVISLNTNYRSTPNILECANAISFFMGQKITDGFLHSGKNMEGNGAPVNVVAFQNSYQEGEMIAAAVMRDKAQGVAGKDIAILYRSRQAKTIIERELVKNGIDYKIVGDISFYQRSEVKNAIALMRMTFRPWDTMAIMRVLKNTAFGVSDASVKKAMTKERISAHAHLEQLATKMRNKTEMSKVATKVAPFLETMKGIRQLAAAGEDSAYLRSSFERLWEIYMLGGVRKAAEKDAAPEDQALENRMENVSFLLDRFFGEMEQGRKPEEILEELSLLGEQKRGGDYDDSNHINLMTIHGSKGLEFHNVYIPAMDEDTTPGESEDIDDLEEERRICYVGITRAMKKLSISYAKDKVKYGNTRIRTTLSPFLKQMCEKINKPVINYTGPKSQNQAPSP